MDNNRNKLEIEERRYSFFSLTQTMNENEEI
jgi:hypothetical protein